MFEYILAGFTGSFFSYFCVFWAGVEVYAFAHETTSERVIKVINRSNDDIERKLDQIIEQIKK
jgi:hypothetical protein